ncbi:MAG TPA: hypothetical protein PKL30_24935 [Leptospiraceae bacterium]|nr:hypothetical protein [Leptospiraceae bacterium]HMY34442.1 hypothetical protein [Leptospiraceae bacterium]HNA07566.1 hypothetical protein [Leptospiraceae bacterium]HNC59731.1 hypothetical protein [Leptospiraceae bacterium]HNH58333.1 hypothetical protein [Leptospiraceae bacterium]
MAIYGIGYNYNGNQDKSSEFISYNCVCVGWEKDEAPAVFKMLNQVRIGDYIYLKTRNIQNKTLIIKGISIVTEEGIKKFSFGNGLSVKWIWQGSETFSLTDNAQFNVYNNTFYEEFHPEIQKLIVNKSFP